MPGFNQKGPMGEGAMTGRKMGRCTNYGAKLKDKTPETHKSDPETMEDDFRGRGFGFGRGRGGRGFGLGRNRFRGGN